MLVVPPVLVVEVQQLAVVAAAAVRVTHRPHRPHRRAINKETVTMMADSDFAVAIRRPNRTAYRRQVSDKIVQVSLALSPFPCLLLPSGLPGIRMIQLISMKLFCLFLIY